MVRMKKNLNVDILWCLKLMNIKIKARLRNKRVLILGALPMIATSVHCLTPILWYSTMLLYVFLSIWGLFKARYHNYIIMICNIDINWVVF